jgi:hypothetical protein
MQDGCKVHMDSYMASNGSCFVVTWAMLKNNLFEGKVDVQKLYENKLIMPKRVA